MNRRLGRERMRRVTSMGKAYNLGADFVFEDDVDFRHVRGPAMRPVAPEDVARVSARYLVDGPTATVVVR